MLQRCAHLSVDKVQVVDQAAGLVLEQERALEDQAVGLAKGVGAQEQGQVMVVVTVLGLGLVLGKGRVQVWEQGPVWVVAWVRARGLA